MTGTDDGLLVGSGSRAADGETAERLCVVRIVLEDVLQRKRGRLDVADQEK